MTTEETLARQDACHRAHDRMRDAILNYEPCFGLTISDVRFLADWASTVSFDAIEEVDRKEGRKP